jgi:2-oxoisovalerate dehydrogenase E1 component alpha subunit
MIVTNNRWGISTPYAGQHGCDQISERGKAFGLQTAVVDGNDPEASYAALSKAIEYVRTHRKPYLLEAMVSRLRGHSSASGANVVKGEIDCVALFEERLEERRLMTRAEIDQVRQRYTQEFLEASQRVLEEPAPTPESVWDYVFADNNHVGEEKP